MERPTFFLSPPKQIIYLKFFKESSKVILVVISVFIELPYDPAIPLLGIHTQESRIDKGTYTPMFIAALFTIARTWKQPRCPSADE